MDEEAAQSMKWPRREEVLHRRCWPISAQGLLLLWNPRDCVRVLFRVQPWKGCDGFRTKTQPIHRGCILKEHFDPRFPKRTLGWNMRTPSVLLRERTQPAYHYSTRI